MKFEKKEVVFMDSLKMLTREEVATDHNNHVDTVTMWVEVGILKPIKTGKCYMFSQDEIKRFQQEYKGLDVSNRVKAIESYKKVNGLD